jgi:hypothetical protein
MPSRKPKPKKATAPGRDPGGRAARKHARKTAAHSDTHIAGRRSGKPSPPAPTPEPVAAPKARMGRPPYEPTAAERQWVTVAAAGAMPAADMCAKLAISQASLRKAFRSELNAALPDLTVRVHANFVRIAMGDSKAAAWAAERWLRMRAPEQWRERIIVDDGKPADQPMRVVVEFVGEPAASVESAAPRTGEGTRLSGEARKHVQLVG